MHRDVELYSVDIRDVGAVDIRGVEIDYFVQLFTTFGVQCAMIAGAQLLWPKLELKIPIIMWYLAI